MCLADLEPNHRLNELDFLLPIRSQIVSPLLRDELVDLMGTAIEGPVTRAYVESLKQLRYESLTGFLNGSIDLVFTASDDQTTIISLITRVISSTLNATRTRLCSATITFGWPMRGLSSLLLQYHLYSVALHRFLRHRIPDYDYEQHFGGARISSFVECWAQQCPSSRMENPWGLFSPP